MGCPCLGIAKKNDLTGIKGEKTIKPLSVPSIACPCNMSRCFTKSFFSCGWRNCYWDKPEILDLPPTQDTSHHQDIGSGNPKLNLYLPLAFWVGGRCNIYRHKKSQWTSSKTISPKNNSIPSLVILNWTFQNSHIFMGPFSWVVPKTYLLFFGWSTSDFFMVGTCWGPFEKMVQLFILKYDKSENV